MIPIRISEFGGRNEPIKRIPRRGSPLRLQGRPLSLRDPSSTTSFSPGRNPRGFLSSQYFKKQNASPLESFHAEGPGFFGTPSISPSVRERLDNAPNNSDRWCNQILLSERHNIPWHGGGRGDEEKERKKESPRSGDSA
jgi:hypothetical protein